MSAAVEYMAQKPIDQLGAFLASCRHDPLRYVLGMYPWGQKGTPLARHKGPRKWQYEDLKYVGEQLRADPFKLIRMGKATGHGVGKSAEVAMLTQWGLDTCLDTRVVATANTESQLRNKTWAEMAKWNGLRISEPFWECGKTALFTIERSREMNWRADAIPWSEHRPESFAGLHNEGRRIILIFDEASAIPDIIWETAEGALTDADTEMLWLVYGNPTRNTGRFRECFPGGLFAHRWHTISLDAREIEGTNKEQLNEWVEDHGEDSDFVRIRVKGEFPDVGDKQFIGGNLVREASTRPAHREGHDPVLLGVDVARFGSNETVIAIRAGRDARSIPWKHYNKMDAVQVAARVIELIKKHNPDATFVDGDGIGGPVCDIIRSHHFPVHEVNSGKQAYDPDTYYNLRTEMWGKMRDWLDIGMLPQSKKLHYQLIAPEYGFTNKNQIQLESKDLMERRGIASPDWADALALTFAMPVLSRGVRSPGSKFNPRRSQKPYHALDRGL